MDNNDELIKSLEIKRKQIVKYLESDQDATFKLIFEFIRPTVFAKAVGLNAMRMKPRAADPSLFKVRDLINIATFLKVPTDRVFKLAIASLPKNTNSVQP